MNQLLKRIDEAVHESIAQTKWHEDIADETEDQQYGWGEEKVAE